LEKWDIVGNQQHAHAIAAQRRYHQGLHHRRARTVSDLVRNGGECAHLNCETGFECRVFKTQEMILLRKRRRDEERIRKKGGRQIDSHASKARSP